MRPIQLTRGQWAIVDDEDADLMQFNWHANFHKSYAGGGNYSACRDLPRVNGKRSGSEYMHRVIMSRMLGRELLRSEQVDHINGDPLCNLRSNLRLATRMQNAKNRRTNKSATSGYKGVYWHKHTKKWSTEIRADNKRVYLGYYNTPEEAYEAYCKAAKELHGEFACLE